jgi:hypothetical protein
LSQWNLKEGKEMRKRRRVEKVRERGDQTIEVSVGQSNLSRGHKRERQRERERERAAHLDG